VLHDPSDIYTARYYGGRPDALWMGQNIELTNRLTLQRRPGLTAFSTFTYPTVPLREFSFQLTDGTIRVIIDTGSSGNLSVASAANASGGNTVYTGTFPSGAGNGLVGLIFTIVGFVTNVVNNGSYTCVASTATTITLANPNGVSETIAATATTAGGVYWDQQNGSAVLLFGKSAGAGQTYFTAVSGVLYMGDGVDIRKYTPLNSNATVTVKTPPQPSTTTNTIWNWSGAAPTVAPAVTLKSAGSAGGSWQASTWFSTMGLIVDANGNIWQLHAIKNPLVTVGTVGLVGTSSAGGPSWNLTPGLTTSDNTVTWRCLSAINARVPGSQLETETQAYTSNPVPCAYYDQISGNIYVCIHATSGGNLFNGPIQGLSLAPGQSFPDGNDVMMSIGNSNNIPNGYCQGQWKPSQVIPSQANPPTRLIIPFQIPRPGSPLTQTLYLFEQTVSGTTSASGVIFSSNPTPGVTTVTEPASGDATGSQLQWVNVYAANNSTGKWVAGASYPVWQSPTSVNFGVMVDNNGSFWVAVQQPPNGALVGVSGLTDPVSVAGYYWLPGHVYAGGTIVIDSNSNRQQAQGTGGTSQNPGPPSWNRNQGGTTTDNGVTWRNLGSAYGTTIPDGLGATAFQWVNVGRDSTWTANQKFYLPTQGFYTPTNGALGSVNISDGTNSEFVVQTGLSGNSAPTWNTNTQVGSNETYDPSPAAAGGVVWYNNGPFSQGFITPFTKSHTWAYSYKNRTLGDFYSAVVAPAVTPPTPPGLVSPLPPPTGAQNNTITTASPATTISGAQASAVATIYGNYSSDPQFDTIVIWRDPDGVVTSAQNPVGMLELTEIPNIPSRAGVGKYNVNGILYDWAFQDFLPDTPTATFPGLNPLIPAPINHQNDPPPTSFRPMVYNFTRIWGSYLLQVNFSGGPDVITGNPNEAFLVQSDELPFLAPVQRLVQTPQGLVALTTNSVELVAGGPQTLSFYSVKLSANMGLLSFNALDVFAGEIFFFSADNQFFVLSPSLSVSNFGFPLGDQFANQPSSGVSDTTWNPANVYVAVHQSGVDNCIFVSDGSTGWYRLNPRQIPGVAQGPEPIWSPFAKITGGAQMVQSIEFAPGKKILLVGAAGLGTLSKRTLGVYTDNGTQYDAFFVMGSIVLAHPGQLGLLKFLECDFSGQGFRPTVSYLLNEFFGTFTPFKAAPTFDPPSIYGQRFTPVSYSPNRYYFASNAVLARCRHLQIRVDYGQTPNGDEIYDMTIYGRIVVEL